MEQNYRRQVAVKTTIANLLAQAALPDALGRVNLIAAVVGKEGESQYPTLVLDDGTAHVTARSFESPELIRNAPIGEIALIIGRPRVYNGQPYLIPEIIKPLQDRRWVEVRLRELAREAPSRETAPVAVPETRPLSPELLLEVIRKLDTGAGAEIGTVLAQLSSAAEPLVDQLLARGEIFQLRPGVVKVLE